ncbi:MAG: helix-turn-helix domain-containing protein [Alphaproteobacteria bacterium]|nr:helix-turn-helix domain-containing protein [Alphaproteobacteria bacterium]MBU2379262.1 helix-turn-helix domain-containing protein [Alphaproteobacteria bacterium]
MTFKTDTAKIKRWREERHWSQEHLAELSGIGLRTLQRIETGQQASDETLKALANAYQIDVSALAVDPEVEAINILQARNAKIRSGLRLSLWIHLAGYAVGMAVFVAISVGVGAFVMKWPLIWWTVGAISHVATVVIVEQATLYQERE